MSYLPSLEHKCYSLLSRKPVLFTPTQREHLLCRLNLAKLRFLSSPRLSKLVMAREGKNLIQKCLTVTEEGCSPPTDFPDPKVKHYAPRNQKPHQQHPTPPTPISPVRGHPPPITTSMDTSAYVTSAALHSPMTSFVPPNPIASKASPLDAF